MAETWKRTVTSFSDRLFPGLSYPHPYSESDYIYFGNEIISSLPLQMSLYFNVLFFPIWLITVAVMLHVKYDCLSNMYRFIVVTVLVAVIGIECLRLYLGYLGNLTEKIPELAGFWMLSLLLQFPLQIFLFANERTVPQVVERAVQGVMLSLLVVELVSGFIALRRAARHQTKRKKHYGDEVCRNNAARETEKEMGGVYDRKCASVKRRMEVIKGGRWRHFTEVTRPQAGNS
uniref:Transmembrane protein 17 n=1 Tax=Timema bartmani TaxID=61472 RepID=A0A7R9EY12_9NEOP|nr:unnamed protein product [Timema bartmani]